MANNMNEEFMRTSQNAAGKLQHNVEFTSCIITSLLIYLLAKVAIIIYVLEHPCRMLLESKLY